MNRLATKASFNSTVLGIVEKYIAAGGKEPICPREVARWAIDHREWDRHRTTAVSLCAKDIARALREDYYIDEKGRTVRARHSIREMRDDGSGQTEQLTFWHDHRTMPRPFAERSFQQRRVQIVGDCKQLKIDVDSYNDYHPGQDPIQLVIDFTYDVAESEMAHPYNPPRKAK
jgi:hypothetical protein